MLICLFVVCDPRRTRVKAATRDLPRANVSSDAAGDSPDGAKNAAPVPTWVLGQW